MQSEVKEKVIIISKQGTKTYLDNWYFRAIPLFGKVYKRLILKGLVLLHSWYTACNDYLQWLKPCFWEGLQVLSEERRDFCSDKTCAPG